MLAAYAWIEDGIDGRLENSEEPCYLLSFFIFPATGGVTGLWERNTQMLEVLRIARYSLDSQNYYSSQTFFRNTMMIWQKIMRLLLEPGATIVQR